MVPLQGLGTDSSQSSQGFGREAARGCTLGLRVQLGKGQAPGLAITWEQVGSCLHPALLALCACPGGLPTHPTATPHNTPGWGSLQGSSGRGFPFFPLAAPAPGVLSSHLCTPWCPS